MTLILMTGPLNSKPTNNQCIKFDKHLFKHCAHLVGEEELVALVCGLYTVHPGLFAFPLRISGRQFSVIVAFPGHHLYYSRLSLSQSPRDFLKYFEISVPRRIRFAELRKNKSNNHISQMNM